MFAVVGIIALVVAVSVVSVENTDSVKSNPPIEQVNHDSK